MPLTSFPVGYLLLGMQPTLNSNFPSDTPLKETKYLFTMDYHLEFSSGLGMGHLSTSLTF